MRYIDVCSGISAPTAAWKPLGWQALCFAEIEAAPRSVLAHHYPDVPLRGDFTEIKGDEYGPVDLLVGGTPCQSFSVAGLRGGLADERGNLALEYLRLADRARPRWLVWENVPGVLSSNGGRDFGTFLGGLAQLGYGFAYAVLDAQHFGVPQRRRRVFVVGYLGDWRRAAAVLFERHSLQGHPAPRREKGEGSPGRIARSVTIRGRDGIPQAELGDEVANAILTPNGGRAGVGVGAILDEAFGGGNTSGPLDVAACLVAKGQKCDFEVETFIAHSLRGEGFDASEDGTGRGTPLVPVHCREIAGALTSNYGKQPDSSDTALGPNLVCFSAKDHGADAGEIAPTLRAGGHSGSHANAGVMPAIAFSGQMSVPQVDHDLSQTLQAKNPQAVAFSENQQGAVWESETAQALNKGGGKPGQGYTAIRAASAVRRLTPRECERLQGFEDDFTLVPHRGKPMADGPRYKMLGNSMAVPVVQWIGQRIAVVDAMSAERLAA